MLAAHRQLLEMNLIVSHPFLLRPIQHAKRKCGYNLQSNSDGPARVCKGQGDVSQSEPSIRSCRCHICRETSGQFIEDALIYNGECGGANMLGRQKAVLEESRKRSLTQRMH